MTYTELSKKHKKLEAEYAAIGEKLKAITPEMLEDYKVPPYVLDIRRAAYISFQGQRTAKLFEMYDVLEKMRKAS